MKRVALAALLLLATHAAPALAGPGDAVEVELEGLQRGAVIEGTLDLTAIASSAAGIKRIQITINDQLAKSVEPSGLKQSADLSYGWVTSLQVDSAELAPNGEYVVTATATANGGADGVATGRVIVDNPAATPQGVTSTVTSDGVSLTWDPNPEPDLLGYQIERGSGEEFEILGHTTDTAVVDPVGPGTYSYRVTAIRSSAARSSGRPSAPSTEVLVSIQGDPKGSPDREGLRGADGPAAPRDLTGAALSAPQGLPSGAALPGAVGLPDLPTAGTALGTYEAELPYDIPEGGIPLSAQRAEAGGASYTLIPTDGLRWVAAGALLLALATLLRLFAQRLDTISGPSPLPRPARSLKL